MDKKELVALVAEESGESKACVERVIESLLSNITKTCAKGEDVRFIGFGTFSRVQREAKEGRNPATGAKITIPARRAPKFTAGKGFRKAVEEAKA